MLQSVAKLLILNFLLLFLQGLKVEASIYQWIESGEGVDIDLLNMGLEPAGHEGATYTFIARVQPNASDSRRSPGKLKVASQLLAHVTEEVEKTYSKFEVLVSPPGSLSWYHTSIPGFFGIPIEGGVLPDRRQSYVCRVLHSRENLVVGFLPYGGETQYTCKYELDGNVFSANSFELLNINPYGQNLIKRDTNNQIPVQ